MEKQDVLIELENVMFHRHTVRVHFTKQHMNKIQELNILLLESLMPFRDRTIQKRAIGTIANLEKQIRV